MRVKPPLRQDAGYGQRMRDVGLAGFAELALMGVLRKGEGALDQRDVRGRQVIAKVSGKFGDFLHLGDPRARVWVRLTVRSCSAA